MGTLFNKKLVTDELVKQRYEMSIGKNYDAQLRRRAALPLKAINDELRGLSKKTLLLWGNNDRGVTVERGHLLFEKIAKAEFHLFGQCAHWVQMDQADRFNSLVVDFLHS